MCAQRTGTKVPCLLDDYIGLGWFNLVCVYVGLGMCLLVSNHKIALHRRHYSPDKITITGEANNFFAFVCVLKATKSQC